MEKGRYILRYRGEGSIPAEQIDAVRASEALEILDAASRMLLVEGEPDAIERVTRGSPDWLIIPEVKYGLPDPRPRIKK